MNRNRALWIAQGLLAAFFLFVGFSKLTASSEMLATLFPGESVTWRVTTTAELDLPAVMDPTVLRSANQLREAWAGSAAASPTSSTTC